MLRVAVIDDYQGAMLGSASWDGLDVTVFRDHVAGDELAARLAGYPVVVCIRERTVFSADLVAALPDLRLLVCTGMGTAHLDVDALRAAGVVVSGTPGSGLSTAELTFGLMIALARSLVPEVLALRDGTFGQRAGLDLAGARLGLIGLGRLGSQVARIGAAFGMDVVAWSAHLAPDHAEGVGAQALPLDELLSTSDWVSIHTRLSERTRGLLGARELGLMKPTAYLVNTSRGPVVDEAALLAALHDGTIAGAGLDVFDTEPLPPDHPLLSAPNALLTPHLGYSTEAVYRQFAAGAVEDVTAWQAGAPIRLLA